MAAQGLHHQGDPLKALQLAAIGAAFAFYGCGGHESRTLKMRTALDEGQPKRAIAAINEELDVKASEDLPAKLEGDNALLVLDRGAIQQSLAEFKWSKRDYEAADKAIDMLDLSRNAADTIGTYMFSDASGRYKSPPYEKLLVNALNMVNYLDTHDLNGAKIEARRFSVYQKYFRDKLKSDNAVLGLAGFLAGYTFEKSGDVDEALRYYDEALQFGQYEALRDSVREVFARGSYRSPRLTKAAGDEKQSPQSLEDTGEGEIVAVIGYGRVPHKVPNRIPIGLALTYASQFMSPADVSSANKLAAQGLVTWVNYPTLAPEQGSYESPQVMIDRKRVPAELAVNVSAAVREEWKKIEGGIIVSAITRMITRFAVGQGIQAAAGRDSILGVLASLGAQATLTALDVPDTRSWETLPARIAVARLRVPAGRHEVWLDARGVSRKQQVDVEKGGWAFVSLMALR